MCKEIVCYLLNCEIVGNRFIPSVVHLSECVGDEGLEEI